MCHRKHKLISVTVVLNLEYIFKLSHALILYDRYKKMVQSLKNTMMVVVESLINKFEEDQMRKEEMHRKNQHEQHSSHYTDNCSDSDSSFNQVIFNKTRNALQI